MSIRVEKVEPKTTLNLRQVVLRPNGRVEDLDFGDDDAPLCATFGALDDDDVVIGTARVALADLPAILADSEVDDGRTWQLRAMATREDMRNLGVGQQVLEAALQHVADNGGGLLWCNARVAALSFYQRAGFVEHGDVWIEPGIGPHIVMSRPVEDTSRNSM